MLYPCCVSKLRTSVRSCGSWFPRQKTLLVFHVIPLSFARRIYFGEMSLGKFEKCWSYVTLALSVPGSLRPGVLWARAGFPGASRLPRRLPTDPHDGCGFVRALNGESLKLSRSWGFSRTLVHANENPKWNPWRIPAAWSQVLGHWPAPLRWSFYPATPCIPC